MEKYQPKLAIIIPTLENDDILLDTIESIIDTMDMNLCKIIIIDQNHPSTYSDRKNIFYRTAASDFHNLQDQKIMVIPLGYNCGAGYARNEGFKFAKRYKIPYVLMSNDNIKFNKNMSNVFKLTSHLHKFSLIGFEILNYSQKIGNLELIKNNHFKFTSIKVEKCKSCYKKLIIFKCNIVSNFYLTSTNIYNKVRYDDNLVSHEKEDFFIRLSWNNFKVGFTKYCNGNYTESPISKIKLENFSTGYKKLKHKYNLK